jgi:hypothetical protein
LENYPIKKLILSTNKELFAICQLGSQSPVPGWVYDCDFFSITRTHTELSIICPEMNIPDNITSSRGWRVIKIEGKFDFNEIGVLNSITTPLAKAQISLLTTSTYDTDYILIQESHYDRARLVLKNAGHQLIEV